MNLLGGWDIWLSSLVFLMAADIIVGLIKAFLCKSDKSVSGGLNSASMFKGGLKKILIFFIIADNRHRIPILPYAVIEQLHFGRRHCIGVICIGNNFLKRYPSDVIYGACVFFIRH